MKPITVMTALSLAIPTISLAQEDWRADLAEEFVTIQGSKMVIEEYSIERMNVPGYEPYELQLRYYAEAPNTGVISRDFFVATSTFVGIMVVQGVLSQPFGLTGEQFWEYYEPQDLDSPIGRPDLEISVFMTGEGFQLEVRDAASGGVSRNTETWANMFGDNR